MPGLGEGAIFPVSDESILEEPFEVPKFWPQIGGLDFGYDHPFAGTKLAHDRDNDCVHVCSEYRERQATPVIHCAALRRWGEWLPWAWPHDGLQHDKGSGEQLAQQYRDEGLNLLPERATFDDESFGVEAGLSDMLVRMQTGRWKVFRTCRMWMEEKRLYHRKKTEAGRIEIVKVRDDLISSSRYALMMLRFADVFKAGTLPQIDWEFA